MLIADTTKFNSRVTIENAKHLANTSIIQVNKFSTESDLIDVRIENENSSVIFYNLDGSPSAFMFKLQKNNNYFGYITISATKDIFPLIELIGHVFPVEIWLNPSIFSNRRI